MDLDLNAVEDDYSYLSPSMSPTAPAAAQHDTMETRRSKQFRILASLLLSFLTMFLLRVFFSAWIVCMTFNIAAPCILDSLGIQGPSTMYKPLPYHAAVMIVIMTFVLIPSKG